MVPLFGRVMYRHSHRRINVCLWFCPFECALAYASVRACSPAVSVVAGGAGRHLPPQPVRPRGRHRGAPLDAGVTAAQAELNTVRSLLALPLRWPSSCRSFKLATGRRQPADNTCHHLRAQAAACAESCSLLRFRPQDGILSGAVNAITAVKREMIAVILLREHSESWRRLAALRLQRHCSGNGSVCCCAAGRPSSKVGHFSRAHTHSYASTYTHINTKMGRSRPLETRTLSLQALGASFVIQPVQCAWKRLWSRRRRRRQRQNTGPQGGQTRQATASGRSPSAGVRGRSPGRPHPPSIGALGLAGCSQLGWPPVSHRLGQRVSQARQGRWSRSLRSAHVGPE